mmetsp:Transcript_32323/g.84582  ORF Transcript_32323/g.84582 Transcript_32323/m.84582 type:complete len:965 (+) Transcript_32323:231-3125(+)
MAGREKTVRDDVAGWSSFVVPRRGSVIDAGAKGKRPGQAVHPAHFWALRPRALAPLYGTMPGLLEVVTSLGTSLAQPRSGHADKGARQSDSSGQGRVQWARWVVARMCCACARGVGQVVFMNNPITGLLITIAIFVASPYAGALMVLGTVAGTATAMAFEMDAASIDSGLFGYNGALVGVCLAHFHYGSDLDPAAEVQVVAPVVAIGALSTVLTASLGSVASGVFGLSPFTFPFVLASWIWLAGCAGDSFTYFPLDSEALQATLPVNAAGKAVSEVGYGSPDVLRGILRGVGQVYFQDDAVASAIIVVGMWFCSPVSAAMALFGSAVGTLTAISLGADRDAVDNGIFGYNGSLCAIALGGVFFVLHGRAIWMYTVMACMLSTIVTAATASFLSPSGLPALTFPFVLSSWLFVLGGRSIPSVTAVDLGAITVAEDHRRRWELVKHVSSKFLHVKELAEYMHLSSSERLQALEDGITAALMCLFAQRGDTAALDALLARGADVNATDHDGRTAAHLAAAGGHAELLDRLVNVHGASVTVRDARGGTCFNDAVRSNNEKCITLARPQVTERKKTRRSTFLWRMVAQSTSEASSGSSRGSAELLNPRGQDAAAKGADEATPSAARRADFGPEIGSHMCILAMDGKDAQLATMARAGVDPNVEDYDGRTALHVAASCGDADLCTHLLALGADPKKTDHFGSSAVDDARRAEFDGLARMLCETTAMEAAARLAVEIRKISAAGASPPAASGSRADRGGVLEADDDVLLGTILCEAAHTRDVALMQELTTSLSSAQLRNARNYDHRTPLHVAAENADEEMVRFLVSRGVPKSQVDRWGHSPVVCAALQKSTSIVNLLRKAGASVVLPDVQEALLLCSAVHSLDHELLKHLLLAGFTPDSQNYDGRSAMHIAARSRDHLAFSMLVEAGGNAVLRDGWGIPAESLFADVGAGAAADPRSRSVSPCAVSIISKA